MAPFLNRVRAGATAPGSSKGSTASKKDSHAPQLSSIERHLLDGRPLRGDGSDSFWGYENHSNTCYANSILQCLYYTPLFRQNVVNYPQPTPYDSIINSTTGLQRVFPNTVSLPMNHPSLTYSKIMNRPTSQNPPNRSPASPPTSPRPENKDEEAYRKRFIASRGPNLTMNYDNATAYGMPESLFTSLKDIFEAISVHQSHTGVVSPSKFLEILKRDNEMFRSAMHQDAHEFFNLLINDVLEKVEAHAKMVEEEANPNGSSDKSEFERALAQAMPQIKSRARWIHDLFQGTLTSETKCLTCENISQRDEVFLDLSVDLEEHASVTSCLRKFSEEEMLCERNKFHCDNCGGLQEAEKRIKIKSLPRVLTLHLKRFKFTDDFTRLQKLFHRIVYPFHLRLFNTTDDAEDPDRLYELYAVVVHIGGTPYHGHYVSIIKTEDRGWLLFDDEEVQPVDKNFVQNYFGAEPYPRNFACAYVLFYQETTVEAMKREQEVENHVLSQTAGVPTKENGALSKTNGLLGGIHHSRSAATPASVEDAPPSLDKIASDPSPATAQPPSSNGELTALPQLPTTPNPAVELKSKKDRQKEEKERKAVARREAKDEERAEKERRKTVELLRRENAKKPDSETKQPGQVGGGLKGQDERTDADQNGLDATTIMAGGLNRFRTGSKSFRKPKFLGGSSREASKDDPLPDGYEPEASKVHAQPNGILEKPEKPPDKSKYRFSALRKKTSSMML